MAKGSGGTGKGSSVGGRVSKVAAGAAPALAGVSEASILTAARGLADRIGRVDLADLRPKLGGTREQQDKALLDLMDAGKGVLFHNDLIRTLEKRSPAEAARHRAAAVKVGGGAERHMLMLEKRYR